MKASIIILTYKQEATIGRAIESVLRQKCQFPFEILVADDNSPDRTREIAEEYASKYPHKVRIMPELPNRGLVDNYFDAFEECRGEYIGDCAGDDTWLDESRLERQIEMLDADPSLSVVFTDVEEFTVKSSGEVTSRLYSSRAECRRWMKERVSGDEITVGALSSHRALPFTLSAALYRKSALQKTLEKNAGLVRIPGMGVEDVPVIAALGQAGDAAYLPLIGYRYYVAGESVSNNLTHEKEFRFYKRVLLGEKKISMGYGIDQRKLKTHYNLKLAHIAAQARHIGDKTLVEELKKTAEDLGIPLPLRARLHILLLRLGVTRLTLQKNR